MKIPLLAKFKIHPRGRWHFFTVFVWKRVEDMRRELKRCGVRRTAHTEAICCCNEVINVSPDGKVRRTGCMGQIHFHRGSFSMGIITHECGHAALAWVRHKGIDPAHSDGSGDASESEEAFCWVLGNLARQVVLKTSRQWDFDGSTVRDVTRYH